MRLKLGEATTNTQGIAVYEYTGTGTGELSVRAKAGALISDVHSFWDTLMFDLGTSTYHTDSIWNNLNYITRGDEYSTIYREDGDAMKYITISGNICIECDVMTTMTNSGGVFNIRNASGNIKTITGTDVGGASNTWKHTKLTIIDNKLTVEGSSIVDFDVTGFDRFTIRSASTYSTYFKNVVVYSVGDVPAPVEPVVTSLTLSNTKDILSAYDSESTTLTATVKDQNSSVMSGQTVVFKKGSSTLDTKTTNSNGVATYTYTADGSGDVTITVECESLTQTQSIEDCDGYFTTSDVNNFNRKTKGSDVFAVSSYSIGLTDYSVEFKNTNGVQITVGDENNWTFACDNAVYSKSCSTHSSNGSVASESNVFQSTNTVYRVEVEGTTIRVYQANTLLKTYTNRKISDYPTNLRIYTYNNRGNVEYIKVKPL